MTPRSPSFRPAFALLTSALLVFACSKESTVVDQPPPDDTTGTPPETTITNPPPPPPPASFQVVTVAGNIASCGQPNDEMTAELIDSAPGIVMTAGDNAFPDGGMQSYRDCYTPTWGRFLNRTWAVLGNHEYDLGNADGAFDYFGDHAGPRGQGYYSMDLGDWHIIVLNDNGTYVPFASGSAQETWLKADLAANTKKCVMALWHVPYFVSSTQAGYYSNPTRKTLWMDLYAGGADIVVNGHQHHYERMAPMLPDGTADASGIRQFNVGTGGSSTAAPTVVHPNSQVISTDYGVLRLTLRAADYDWKFIPVRGASFTDSGTGTCH